MDKLTFVFIVGIITALILVAISIYSDWKEKHSPKKV